MTPEFEFIYPFAKGTFSDKTNPHFGEDTAFLSFPKRGKCPYTGKKTWVCEVSASQHDQPCSHFKEWKPNITLTLTREQAERFIADVDCLMPMGFYGAHPAIGEMKKQIKEKLK